MIPHYEARLPSPLHLPDLRIIISGWVRNQVWCWPILMTTLAMIAGMIPMASGMGDGGEQVAPLGQAVIGGLILSTITSLLVAGGVELANQYKIRLLNFYIKRCSYDNTKRPSWRKYTRFICSNINIMFWNTTSLVSTIRYAKFNNRPYELLLHKGIEFFIQRRTC